MGRITHVTFLYLRNKNKVAKEYLATLFVVYMKNID